MANNRDATNTAVELVKIALQAGWMSDAGNGEIFAREVGVALSELKTKLLEVQDQA